MLTRDGKDGAALGGRKRIAKNSKKAGSVPSPPPSWRKLITWIGGSAAAIIGTVVTAHLTGILGKIMPSPDDTLCRLTAPMFEQSLNGELPGVLVASFAGPGGREAARDVSEEIRSRTGLPALTTCLILQSTTGLDASFESVGAALDKARQLARERGAKIVVLGRMLNKSSADLTVTHTAEFEGRTDARRARVQVSETSNSTELKKVPSFIDNELLSALADWAGLLALRLQSPRPPGLEDKAIESNARSVAAIADHDAPQRWQAIRDRRRTFQSAAFTANAHVSRWHHLCGPSQDSYRFSRLLAYDKGLNEETLTEDPRVAIAALEIYLYCETEMPLGMRSRRGREGVSALWPYAKKLATTAQIEEVEQLMRNDAPWPYRDDVLYGWYGDMVLAKALLSAAIENPASADGGVAVSAALNLLRGEIRRSRREGTPTEKERQAQSKCLEVYGYSIETIESWKIMVSRGIDPYPLIEDVSLSSGSVCGLAN
jgi:hypothetical protein